MTGGEVNSSRPFDAEPAGSVFSHTREIGRGVSPLCSQANIPGLRALARIRDGRTRPKQSTNSGCAEVIRPLYPAMCP